MKKLLLTKEIVEHELNADLNLTVDEEMPIQNPGDDAGCPPDTATGYYVKSGGNCVFVPFT